MIKAVLFDLDGTLNRVNNKEFGDRYYHLLSKHFKVSGLTEQQVADEFRAAARTIIFCEKPANLQSLYYSYIREKLGIDFEKSPELFEDFLENTHPKLFEVFGKREEAGGVVKQLKAEGYKLALATNPLFNRSTIDRRMAFSGVDGNDFDLVTTFDWCTATKPSPEYYLQIAEKLGVSPQECLMVGNDVRNDMQARFAGMQVLLLPDSLENRDGEDYSQLATATLDTVPQYVLNGGKNE